MHQRQILLLQLLRRSSHEERGLKSHGITGALYTAESRSSHEERGLKCDVDLSTKQYLSRSSHEERGLKSERLLQECLVMLSLLSRGAWIEI